MAAVGSARLIAYATDLSSNALRVAASVCVCLVLACGRSENSRAHPRPAHASSTATARLSGPAAEHAPPPSEAVLDPGTRAARRRARLHVSANATAFVTPLFYRGEHALYVLVLEYVADDASTNADPEDDPVGTTSAYLRKLSSHAESVTSLEMIDEEPALRWSAALGVFARQRPIEAYLTEPEDEIRARNVDGDPPAELAFRFRYQVGDCEVSRLAVVDALTGVVEAQVVDNERCSNSPGDCLDTSTTTTVHRCEFARDNAGTPTLTVRRESVTRTDDVAESSNALEQCCAWASASDVFVCHAGTACEEGVATAP